MRLAGELHRPEGTCDCAGNAEERGGMEGSFGRTHDGGGHSALHRARHMFPQDQQLT